MRRLFSSHPGCPCPISSQVTLGGQNKNLRWPGMGISHWLWGGWGYKYFASGNVLLDCKLTGLVSCSDILGTLVRLRFVRLPFYQ